MTSDNLHFQALSRVALATLTLIAGGANATENIAAGVTTPVLTVISSRPDMVSGGDALAKVSLPAGKQDFRVTAAGRDVTAAFKPSGNGEYLGLVTGLPEGKTTLDLSAGTARASVAVQNYPIIGPIISGPHQQYFACATEAAGLGAPLDADCSANTKVEYLYRSTAGSIDIPQGRLPPTPEDFKPYDPAGPRPADMETTTGTDGNPMDFIVRRERGTINRAIYEIVFRHVPGTPLPNPWNSKSQGWNGKLIYEFGGPCNAAYGQTWYLQPGRRADTLAMGYAVVTSTLNIFGNDCNDVRSAETASMVKEHFIERFGTPLFTIGRGASGGSMQLHVVAQDYPGILDGIMPSSSFPDFWSQIPVRADCPVLISSMNSGGLAWTAEQKQATVGTGKRLCTVAKLAYLNPKACPAGIPKDKVYDPETNPKGIRCTIQDNMVTQVGTDPATGFGRMPYDNVGIEYGLKAFNAGTISAEQFVSVNENAGGVDGDGNLTPSRTAIDAQTLHAYYGKGRINTASGSLTEIPILDYRGYTDGFGDIHELSKSYVLRARLMPLNGGRNHVIWVMGDSAARDAIAAQISTTGKMNNPVLAAMDAWLTALKADRSIAPAREKVIKARPADLVDTCFKDDGKPITDIAVCKELFPWFGSPRQAAGGPVTDDILKCRLRRLDRMRYQQLLTDAQWSRLRKTFPQGVCDYTKPGAGYEKPSSTWLRY